MYGDEPKYATLEAFKNAPESKDAVIWVDNDYISADDENGNLLLGLHPTEWIQQSIELLGFSYESV